jgi:hypothetical protein
MHQLSTVIYFKFHPIKIALRLWSAIMLISFRNLLP